MTPTEFKTRFPEFAAETDARVQLFINDAEPNFDLARWDDLYEVGVAYFVAHEISLANLQTKLGGSAGSLAGDVSQKKVGEVSVTRDTGLLNRQADDPFLRTVYGQKYAYYRKLVGMGGAAV